MAVTECGLACCAVLMLAVMQETRSYPCPCLCILSKRLGCVISAFESVRLRLIIDSKL
jgi:hypothetical protein